MTKQEVRGWRRGRRGSLVVTVLVSTGLLASACSSASSSSAPASGSTSSSGTSSTDADSAGISAAKAAVAAAEQAPTTLPISTPLSSKPPTGKTIVWLQCDAAACALQTGGFQAAATALGWKLKVIDYQSANTATLVSGLQQALQYKPVGVILSGADPASWSSVLPAYAAAKVPLIPSDVGPALKIQFPVITQIGAAQANTYPGQLLADWMIADSGGTGKALVVGVPAYPVLAETAAGVVNEIKKQCPGCGSTSLNASFTELSSGGIVPAVVSQLRRDPSIKYVLSTDGAFIGGLSAALKTAGLTGIKIASARPDITNEADVKAGTEAMTIGYADIPGCWLAVDAAARYLLKMPIPAGEGNLPAQLFTTANIGTPAATLYAPSDYAAQFKTLWHASA
jgi:ribose transport system substrate-binding protein